jgi:hypothetical protein
VMTMPRVVHTIALLVMSTALIAQQPPSHARDHTAAIWAPPPFAIPEDSPQPTVPKSLVTRLTVAGWPIELERTELQQAQSHFGGTMGKIEDGSEALHWLCLYGKDKDGLWGLWLLSEEVDGPSIGGIQWQRLPADTQMDRKCKLIVKGSVELPIAVHLGMTQKEAELVLGKPSLVKGDVAVYAHEHNYTVHKEAYVANNDLYVVYQNGVVWSLVVHYAIDS